MSRGGSYGGGQSSLGYLFGSDEPTGQPPVASGDSKRPSEDDKKKKTGKKPAPPSPKQTVSNNNYHRAQGQNTGNFITDRPTTKVQSVPGGDSSLGYLFGDK